MNHDDTENQRRCSLSPVSSPLSSPAPHRSNSISNVQTVSDKFNLPAISKELNPPLIPPKMQNVPSFASPIAPQGTINEPSNLVLGGNRISTVSQQFHAMPTTVQRYLSSQYQAFPYQPISTNINQEAIPSNAIRNNAYYSNIMLHQEQGERQHQRLNEDGLQQIRKRSLTPSSNDSSSKETLTTQGTNERLATISEVVPNDQGEFDSILDNSATYPSSNNNNNNNTPPYKRRRSSCGEELRSQAEKASRSRMSINSLLC
jgi:hypothetical protein